MKKLENREIKEKAVANDYIGLCKRALDAPPPRDGLTTGEMRARIKAYDKCCQKYKIGDIVEFEDAELAKIISCFANLRWATMIIELVEFEDYLKSL